jgi:hypothetical protein
MRACDSLVAPLGGLQRLFERGELAAHRGDLLVEDIDLRERALATAASRRRAAAAPRGRLAGGRRQAGAARIDQPLQAALVLLGRVERGGERGESRLHVGLAERSSARSCVSSSIWRLRRVSAVSLPLTSRDRKNCASMNTDEQEDHHQQHRRQRVDEARPVVDSGRRAGGRARRRSQAGPSHARGARAGRGFRAAGRPAPRPSCGSSAARSACAGQRPGCPRRDWPWRRRSALAAGAGLARGELPSAPPRRWSAGIAAPAPAARHIRR